MTTSKVYKLASEERVRTLAALMLLTAIRRPSCESIKRDKPPVLKLKHQIVS